MYHGPKLGTSAPGVEKAQAEGNFIRMRRTSRAYLLENRSDFWADRCLCSLGYFFLVSAVFWGVSVSRVSADGDYVDGEIVVHLSGTESIEDFNARFGTTTIDAYPVADLYLLEPPDVSDVEEWLELLEDDSAVRSAEPNMVEDTPEGVRSLVIIAVGGEYVDYEDQELTERIGLDPAHAVSRGEGVTIAVLDTGVDPNHEALAGRLSPLGYDFVDNDTEPWEVAPNTFDDDLDGAHDEGFGHGTMVAGILALVAPEATILPLRVLDDDARGDVFTICKAIRYAAEQGADIVNLSFGIPVEVEAISEQIEFIEDLDILLVAGAGNESSGENPYYPAAESHVVMVAATDSADVKADFSDWGDDIDICAPGTGVRSAFPGGLWALGNGCSFATPIVSAGAALALSSDPSLSPRELRDLATTMAEPIDHLPGNAAYEENLGSGRVYLPFVFPEGVASVDPIPFYASGPSVRATPNPVVDRVEFRWVHSDPAEALDLRVFDLAGRQVHQALVRSDHYAWEVREEDNTAVASGVYFVRVTSERRAQFVGRFTIVR